MPAGVNDYIDNMPGLRVVDAAEVARSSRRSTLAAGVVQVFSFGILAFVLTNPPPMRR